MKRFATRLTFLACLTTLACLTACTTQNGRTSTTSTSHPGNAASGSEPVGSGSR